MSSREDLHQLVEQLDAGRLTEAEAALRSLVQRSGEPVSTEPRRRFRFAGGMTAELDLDERSGQILRDELVVARDLGRHRPTRRNRQRPGWRAHRVRSAAGGHCGSVACADAGVDRGLLSVGEPVRSGVGG